jgi:cytochrome c biogenesis protein CcmG, thiol:disulfide interchange protein DsbE
LQSTRSSDSSSDPPGSGPSRTAIWILVALSIAIPAIALALIVTHDSTHSPVATATTTPRTDVAPVDTHKARVGTVAPDFTLPTTAGKQLTLSTLRGRPVVVVFFASWCHPCEEELPVLQRLRRENAGLAIVGVSYHDLSSDSVDFIHRLHVTFPALVDSPAGPVAESYGVRGIPQTVFVDKHGVVRGRVYGETSRKALQPAISDLLAGRNVRPV